ncbi:cytochrome c [Ideonella sp. A 288]|uniref:c-type cytochrome n=1 Tax=Ideonella sp. A 288 TaxID=1962181 RepID=UPI001303633C|nr:cytochrome c [Ideonella sp. A 288]
MNLLRSLTAALLPLVAAANAAAADGAALFNQHCATCHQPTAEGTVGLAPSLKGEHWQRLGAQRQYLPTVVLKGMAGPIKVNGQPFSGSMPPFAGQLGDDDLAAIATHLRGLQGAAADKPYSADEFAPVRAAAGNPSQTRALRRQILGE